MRHGGAAIDPHDSERLRNDTAEAYPAREFYGDAGFRCAATVP
jgi:hypothetical protein